MAKNGMAKSDSMAKDIEDELAYLRATLGTLSGTLEAQGQNVAGTKDVFGRKFAVPVDDEHKATQDPLLVTLFSCAKPHMAGACSCSNLICTRSRTCGAIEGTSPLLWLSAC